MIETAGRRRAVIVLAGLAVLASASPARSQQEEPRASAAGAPAPMDLVWAARDANRIPSQPLWGRQLTDGLLSFPDARDCFQLSGFFQNPACSTQHPTQDSASFPKSLVCGIGTTTPIPGHVNWYPSTYVGPVHFVEKSFDQDINIDIFTGGPGYTATSSERIHGEFDSRETLDHFTTPWWVGFRNAVEDSDAAGQALIDGRLGVMTGLMGTDCEHDCHAELHPVWGLAIRIDSGPASERWAVVARNWGDEGFCSRSQHLLVLDPRQLTLRLPWRAGATGVQVGAGTVFSSNVAGLSYSTVSTPGAFVELTFVLPDPGAQGRIHGELSLQWQGASVAPAPLVEALPAGAAVEDEDSAEGRLGRLVADMTPAQRALYRKSLPTTTAAVRDVQAVRSKPLARGTAGPLQVVKVPDAAATQADVALLKALLRAYDGRLPGLDLDARTLGLEPTPKQ
jgi:hypothetical protein